MVKELEEDHLNSLSKKSSIKRVLTNILQRWLMLVLVTSISGYNDKAWPIGAYAEE